MFNVQQANNCTSKLNFIKVTFMKGAWWFWNILNEHANSLEYTSPFKFCLVSCFYLHVILIQPLIVHIFAVLACADDLLLASSQKNGFNWIVGGCISNNSISSRSDVIKAKTRSSYLLREFGLDYDVKCAMEWGSCDKILRAKFLACSNWRFNAETRFDAWYIQTLWHYSTFG